MSLLLRGIQTQVIRFLDPARTGTPVTAQTPCPMCRSGEPWREAEGPPAFLKQLRAGRAREHCGDPNVFVLYCLQVSGSLPVCSFCFYFILFLLKESVTLHRKIVERIKLPFRVFKQVYGMLSVLGKKFLDISVFYSFRLSPSLPACLFSSPAFLLS